MKAALNWLLMPLLVAPTAAMMMHDGYPLWVPALLILLANPTALAAVGIAELGCKVYERICEKSHT